MSKEPPPRIRLARIVREGPETQQQFAARMGISGSYLSQIINGVRGMPWYLAKRLHKETGIPLEELMEIRADRVA